MFAAPSGCKYPTGGDEGGGDTGLDLCLDCPTETRTYGCYCPNTEDFVEVACYEDQTDVDCPMGCSVVGEPLLCDNQTADTSPSWEPGNYISYNSGLGVYDVDETFLDWLRANNQQLLHDRARVEWQDPYYKFVSVGSGDFVQELGFQTNDILISISGYGLADAYEVGAAVVAVGNNTSWSVVVYRPGTGYVTLYYRLV